MAKSACISYPNGEIVQAKNIQIQDIHKKFYCTTTNCTAEMIPVSAFTEHAHFRSLHIADHISPSCIIRSLDFDNSNIQKKHLILKMLFGTLLATKTH